MSGIATEIVLFSHALAAGLALALLTAWSSRGVVANSQKFSGLEMVESVSPVLFVCVGMTAVMILVNDSLARAFAVGAAIALVRFRVKFEGKLLAMGIFYGVLAGMACGLGRVDIAWIVTGLYFVILLALSLAVRVLFVRDLRRIPDPAPSVNGIRSDVGAGS